MFVLWNKMFRRLIYGIYVCDKKSPFERVNLKIESISLSLVNVRRDIDLEGSS